MTGKPSHLHLSDLRGAQHLATAATLGITDLVEALHHTIVRAPGPLGQSPPGRTDGISGLVYKSVRGITRLVGGSIDALLGLLAPLVAERPSSEEREALLAVVNGLFGDYLHDSGNPLAIAMQFRHSGIALAPDRAALAAAYPQATGRIAVLVHGLCMNDLQWTRNGHDHGAMLAREAGFTPVYLHYDTGRHISSNGRDLDALLERLLREWPVPVERVAIVAHSMGGLVARSACHYAAQGESAWPAWLDALVFLGTPHLGAPLERAGAWIDYLVAISPYTAPFARLGKLRSAGIKDLRHGRARDAQATLLPSGVRCYAVAASTQRPPRRTNGHLRGDGLVPVRSALGVALPATRKWVAFGTGHLELMSSPDVYARMRSWLAGPARR